MRQFNHCTHLLTNIHLLLTVCNVTKQMSCYVSSDSQTCTLTTLSVIILHSTFDLKLYHHKIHGTIQQAELGSQEKFEAQNWLTFPYFQSKVTLPLDIVLQHQDKCAVQHCTLQFFLKFRRKMSSYHNSSTNLTASTTELNTYMSLKPSL